MFLAKLVPARPTHRCSNENIDDESEWTPKDRKTKTYIERYCTKDMMKEKGVQREARPYLETVLKTGRSWPGLVKLFGFIMGEIGRRLAKF